MIKYETDRYLSPCATTRNATVEIINDKTTKTTFECGCIVNENEYGGNEHACKKVAHTAELLNKYGKYKFDPEIAKLVHKGEIPLLNAYYLCRIPMMRQISYIEQAKTMHPDEFKKLLGLKG